MPKKRSPEKERAKEIVAECLQRAEESSKLRQAILGEILSQTRLQIPAKERRRLARKAAIARWSKRRKAQKPLEKQG